MPEPFRSEEDDNRQHLSCLFNVLGIPVVNRCRNCPAAARSSLQNRRCPGDVAEESNILVDAESKIKSLGASSSSSSKVPEADSLSVGALSLADSTDVASKRKEPDDSLRNLSIQAYLKNKRPAPFKELPDLYPNKRLNHLMRISQNENHVAAGSSMATVFIPTFSVDLNNAGVRASPVDMEIDRTQ